MFQNRKISYFLIALMMCGGEASAVEATATQAAKRDLAAGFGAIGALSGLGGVGMVLSIGFLPSETVPMIFANLLQVKISDEASVALTATGHPDKAAALNTASKGISRADFENQLLLIIAKLFGGSALAFLASYSLLRGDIL